MGARLHTSTVFLAYAAYSLNLPKLTTAADRNLAAADRADRCEQVNLNNSIDIRKQLYREAISLVPSAGLAGIGLGHFPDHSCLDNTEVHNSILQTAVEIGIPAGILLAALMAVVFRSLWLLAKNSDDALFALCSVTFAVLISFAYGHVTNDALLFATLGYGAAIAGAAKPDRRDIRMQAVSDEAKPLQQAAAG